MTEYNYSAYNSLPCSAVVFYANENFDIIYANDIYNTNFNNNAVSVYVDDRDILTEALKKADTPQCVSFRCENKSGGISHIVMYAVKLTEDTVLGLLTDNTDDVNEIEKSVIDPLSKIYNRSAAVEMIEDRLNNMDWHQKCALIVLDIDNFKNINDTYGHMYGDAVIAMSAGSIKSILDKDDIIGRFGGDEFFIFTENAEAQVLEKKLESIRLAMLKMRLDTDDENDISCSMGVAIGSSEDKYDTLFRQADSALYKAKENGKNRFEYFDGEYIDNGALSYANAQSPVIDENESNKAYDITTIALEIASKSKNSENAVSNLMRHIGIAVDLDCIQILRFDTLDDKVYLDYQWWKEHGGLYNVIFTEKKGGYYQHNDLMIFRNKFAKEKIFQYTPDFKEGFSKKYQDVFDASAHISLLYASNTENEDIFYVVCFQCWNKHRIWNKQELSDMFEMTKIISMFLKSTSVKSDREKNLEKKLEYSRYGLYSFGKFFEEAGRINREARANNEKIALAHFDFKYFYKFNQIYGVETGDAIMEKFGELLYDFDKTKSIGLFLSGTDVYIIMFRYNPDVDVCAVIEAELQKFCDELGEFKEWPLIIKAGVCFFEIGQNIAAAIDKAKNAKHGINPDKCICLSADYD